jgi:Protein of unknown function (DUF3422)
MAGVVPAIHVFSLAPGFSSAGEDGVADELVPHPWRGRVLAELHARPFGLVETPKRVLHYGFATDAEAAAADREALASRKPR